MFNKILASIGIGAAKVDTVLHTEHLVPGQTFSAEIFIKGGNTEQEISGLDLALMTKIKVEGDDSHYYTNHIIDRWHIADKFTIGADQEKVIPFQAVLHPETPITQIATSNNQSVVWLATGLNIDMALDANDKDHIYVYPNEVVETCVQAMNQMGYRMVKADVEKGQIRTNEFVTTIGCYQELEYRPASSNFFGVKEIELSFKPEAGRTHILIEIDRAFRGDGYRSFSVNHDPQSIANLPQYLQQMLS